jgi:hypothetical protein
MIKSVKSWISKDFDAEINQYLSERYEILNTSCGFEGNQDGMDAVFLAILQKRE